MQVRSPGAEVVVSRLPSIQGERRRELIDLIPQLVLVIDDNGQLAEANHRFLEATGLEYGTFAPWGRLLSVEDAWGFQTAWMAAFQTNEPFEFTGRLTCAGPVAGQWFLFQFRPSGIAKQDRRWYGTMTELRDRQPIQREIDGVNSQLNSRLIARPVSSLTTNKSTGSVDKYRRRSELLSEILDSLLEGVVLLDAGGNVQQANEAARDLFGPELLARPVGDWPSFGLILRADQTPAGITDLPVCLALDGEETPEKELWLNAPDDTRLRCEMRAIPLGDSNGHVRGAVLVCRDVTERRRMEEQLSHLQKLEAIGHLSAGIAHEINTPLQYVGDNLRFLLEAFGELTADRDESDFLRKEVPTAISQSVEGVEHVAAIVRAMKEFAGTGPEDAMVVSLNRVVENVLAVTRNAWKFGVEVTLDLEAGLSAIPGYARDLNQAVYHLFMNAVEAVRESPGGTGSIILRTRSLENSVQLSVGDSGTGIAPDIRAYVFNPFFTTKAPGRHSGQGLTHVLAAVIQRHHGSVELETSELGGVNMIVRLPREW
ncbi:PAS domain-containing sensor histidine kinase [Zavarzinella formosa]|uniref:PAS domain-containing sensor histidine kinase n=1 Tax=Zavarzinella formosa TaxID=360055 RepID=UPI00031E3B88|nr:PAS domain-containing sensor histidine kinase [Zavarzinella formosa]